MKSAECSGKQQSLDNNEKVVGVSPRKHNNPSSGSAEPYWFEWETGLLQVLELMDEDSEVTAVAFQLFGTKGWDDVGVRLRNGTTRLFQMKHSRNGGRLTFGDLVMSAEAGESSEVKPSLLRSLALAWRQEKATRGNVECVLVTNQSSGTNWWENRPPLNEFLEKLKVRISRVISIEEVTWDGEDERYPKAWELVLAEMSDLSATEKMEFIQALTVRLDAPDLHELDESILDRLTSLTGLPRSSVRAMSNALFANLSTWTCHSRRLGEWIDRETLRGCLAAEEEFSPWHGYCEVETPYPFFPSRNQVVETLQASIISASDHRVDFLAADPGAGKTSCISKLARNGTVLWKEQAVSIRFYAYRPIRPGKTDVGSDASIGVTPEALWLGLLWQIRDNLRKTKLLTPLRVPVWLQGMPWQLARQHVLRIADQLGTRWGRRFVICIDGIDHAARARRKNLPEFLQTLPDPDTIPVNVRFLLAGQPADAYAEYPFFLRQRHAAVKVHELGLLTDEDLLVLLRAANPNIPKQSQTTAIRLIAAHANRRTLPTVYLVEEIRECSSIEEMSRILESRDLPDSLHGYYDSIWSSATGDSPDGLRLAAAFALLRERPTGELMASAFSDLGRTSADWNGIMRRLRPLVRETTEGFELVHNDLRVHLDAKLTTEPHLLKEVAISLAKHYRKPTSNRLAAHNTLLSLLTIAGRQTEFANDFTVDWVIESDSLGLRGKKLADECYAAFQAAIGQKNWLLLHAVACASLTLYRLEEGIANTSKNRARLEANDPPIFLMVEGEAPPLELWNRSDFTELISSCQRLLDCDEEKRAALVLSQWLSGISCESLVEQLVDCNKKEFPQHGVKDSTFKELKHLGRIAATCHQPLYFEDRNAGENGEYLASIEEGWVEGLALINYRLKALRLWSKCSPRYLQPWILAVKTAANRERWGEVRSLLNRLEDAAEKLAPIDRVYMGWHAARSKPENPTIWNHPLTLPDYGFNGGNVTLGTLCQIAQWITYSNPVREPAQIAEDLLPFLNQQHVQTKHHPAIRMLLRASAMIGRLLKCLDRGDITGASFLVLPASLTPLIKALWCKVLDTDSLPHEELSLARKIGALLAETLWKCGGEYAKILREHALHIFSDVMIWEEGERLFDMLLESGDQEYLVQAVSNKLQETISEFHEIEIESRSDTVAILVNLARRIDLDDMAKELSERFEKSPLGYNAHDEWIFKPLSYWFEFTRKAKPDSWRDEGMQMLMLDQICEKQGGDNIYSTDILADIGASALECGSNDFEALFDFLATQERKSTLGALRAATKSGLNCWLGGSQNVPEEAVIPTIAIAIALGQWPLESAMTTISEIVTAEGVDLEIRQEPIWQTALNIAAEMQDVAVEVIPRERARDDFTQPPIESRSAEEILQNITQKQKEKSSWNSLSEFASLVEQASKENIPTRNGLILSALEILENSDALTRWVEFHHQSLMERLYRGLSENERWRLLAALTAITGEGLREQMDDNARAFMVAFSSVDLMCRARSESVDSRFATAAFHQLLETHWKWHGIKDSVPLLRFHPTPSSWNDAGRRMLLSLLQTDSCETMYMVMCGVRFFAEAFPEQIPSICNEGLSEEYSIAPILSLGELWATRHPNSLTPALSSFSEREAMDSLDGRLDAWLVSSLHSFAVGRSPKKFSIPIRAESVEMHFPGDESLLDIEPQQDGLMRYNSFSTMANNRLKRAGLVLGSMESAARHMAFKIRANDIELPPMTLAAPKKFAESGQYPRPNCIAEHIVGDAIQYQCAGEKWAPTKAAAVRMTLGYGMDPWIVSAVPNTWKDLDSWPDAFAVEDWYEAGANTSDEVSLKFLELLRGVDLDPSVILMGAALYFPTYKRDLLFQYWLEEPNRSNKPASRIPSGRSFAGQLAGWSFASPSEDGATSVHFVGNLINYPNSELDITPTTPWITDWNWRPDKSYPLRFLTSSGEFAAKYERWIGTRSSSSRRVMRQPFLNRWIARRAALPSKLDEFREWTRRDSREDYPLKHSE